MPATSAIHLQQGGDELISEEVKEIISYHPHWMIRRGNLVFFAVLLLLLLLTLFIEYPDVVAGSARLVAINAPKPAVAHKEGKLVNLLVTAGRDVAKGQHLAVIESTGNYEEVIQLYRWLQLSLATARGGEFENLVEAMPPALYNLGDLQTPYQTLEQEWTQQQQFFGSGYYQRKKSALQKDLVFTAQLKTTINRQEALTRQEQEMQRGEFAAYDSLAKDKLIAPLELNKYKSGLLAKEQSLVQSDAAVINNDAAAHNKQKELLDLDKQVMDQEQKLQAALALLKTATEAWIQQYVVTAPESGTVQLVAPLQANEQVTTGQELFYVQPALSNYYAQLMAGQGGLGKVKEGQAVRLKVQSYPSEEYGYVKGVIRSVSAFPNRRDSFLVSVDLPQGLHTAYGKEIFFRNGLSASAEVITDNRKLFDRFFDPLKKLWKR